jgi:predicted Zn-dependent protease
MKFVPRQPREGINVSRTHPLAEAGTLVIALTAMFAAVALLIIFLFEFILLFLPPDTEARLFSGLMPEDLMSIEANDPRQSDVRQLLGRLGEHLDSSGYEFRLEITDSDEANAIAFPGGLIVITTALLDATESENELAFVLAHELGHFQNRDHLRMLGRGALLGVLFSAIAGGESGAGFGLTIAQLTQLGFSREQERDADVVGLHVVFSEYGHVADAWRFFERLDSKEDAAASVFAYVSTHPSASSRIDDLYDMAAANGWPIEGRVYPLNR